MSVFYKWLQVSNAKIATLININTSPGKAVFSGTLETDTAGMRGFSCVPVSGCHDFPKEK